MTLSLLRGTPCRVQVAPRQIGAVRDLRALSSRLGARLNLRGCLSRGARILSCGVCGFVVSRKGGRGWSAEDSCGLVANGECSPSECRPA